MSHFASPFSDVLFDYNPVAEPGIGQRWSTWDDIGVTAGPEPRPDWVITADAAVDTELGLLKTGKEADVFLLERATADQAVVLAAKRYRGHTDRAFHRDESYRAGRRTRNTRDTRAAAKGTRWGRTVQADQWARAEFGFLSALWSAGVPVPYPVQLDGTELLMELITTADGTGAPRLAQVRPSPDRLAAYWEQLTDALRVLTSMRLAHGDLSAYNLLAADERVVIIDLPQAVDLIANPQGMEFLARDCRNVAAWFRSRGLDVDGEELLGELASYAW